MIEFALLSVEPILQSFRLAFTERRYIRIHNFHYIKTYYINKIIYQGGRPMSAPTDRKRKNNEKYN